MQNIVESSNASPLYIIRVYSKYNTSRAIQDITN